MGPMECVFSLLNYTILADNEHRFRWAVCQLDALGKCRSRAVLRKALTTLPPTLDQTYDRILSAISETDSNYAISILKWLAFAVRPLSVDEIAEVVAIDVKGKPLFDREEALEDPMDILSICSSLVTITEDETDETSGSVVLAHYSVKEYLVSDRIWRSPVACYGIREIECQDFIAKSCLGYLLQFRESESVDRHTVKEYKLAYYCAKYWMKHAQGTREQTEGFVPAALELLSHREAYMNWLLIYDPDNPWLFFKDKTRIGSTIPPLYYVSINGLGKIVEHLLCKGVDVNAQGGRHGNAIQAASLGGHEQVVKLLLKNGADVNAQGGNYGSALEAASWKGYKAVVKLLLDEGAEVNAQGGDYGNALHAASWRGHEQVIELLLSHGAHVNAQFKDYGTALYTASRKGYEAVVKLLLDNGADPNAQGGYYGNALEAALSEGHEAVVKLLVAKGAKSL